MKLHRRPNFDLIRVHSTHTHCDRYGAAFFLFSPT